MDKIKTLVTIGDSWTWGSELNHDRPNKVWAAHLARSLNVEKFVNLAEGGVSNDYMIRVLTNWLADNYFSKNESTEGLLVVICLTSPERREVYLDDYEDKARIQMFPHSNHWNLLGKKENTHEFSKLYTTLFSPDEELMSRYVHQLFYFQNMFENHKINYLFTQAFFPETWKNSSGQFLPSHTNWKDTNLNTRIVEPSVKTLWELIDDIRFVNKNKTTFSFHNHLNDMNDERRLFIGNHPSEEGHRLLGKYVYDYIVEHNLWS